MPCPQEMGTCTHSASNQNYQKYRAPRDEEQTQRHKTPQIVDPYQPVHPQHSNPDVHQQRPYRDEGLPSRRKLLGVALECRPSFRVGHQISVETVGEVLPVVVDAGRLRLWEEESIEEEGEEESGYKDCFEFERVGAFEGAAGGRRICLLADHDLQFKHLMTNTLTFIRRNLHCTARTEYRLSLYKQNITFSITTPMLQHIDQGYPSRQSHTASEPRFKRLQRGNTSHQNSRTATHNFPSVRKGKPFDNSKENLYYEQKLGKVRSACKLDEEAIVSKYLNTIRKDYDEMSKLSRTQTASMNQKRKEIGFMKNKNQQFVQKREDIEQVIAAKAEEEKECRHRYEDAQMETKTLEHVIIRMKKDQIVYKQLGRLREEELKRKMKEVKALEEVVIAQDEKLHKLVSQFNEFRKVYALSTQARQKKYQDYSEKISDVRERERFIQERQERTYELQSIQLSDTLDQKNIHMREIILSHKVADSLLESKVNRLIAKYAQIQAAFHTVKVKTSISDPEMLAKKFFSYEQTTESLLETIGSHERSIAALQERKEALSEKYSALVNENLIISDGKGQKPDESIYQRKQAILYEINEKQLRKEEVMSWVRRRLETMQGQGQAVGKTTEEQFKMLCQTVKAEAIKLGQANLQAKVQTFGVRLKKLVRQKSMEEISAKLRQTEQMNESNLIEEDYMNTQRQTLYKKGFKIHPARRDSNLK